WPSYSGLDEWPVTTSIQARIILENHGTEPIPLSELTVRYWYSSEASEPTGSFIDFCNRCADEASSIHSVDRPGTDHFVEISWLAGTLEANPDLDVEIHLRVNVTGEEPTSYYFDQSNDWSCNVEGK